MPRHPVRKPTTLGPSLTGRLIAVATSLVFLAVAMLASPAQAVDVPPPGVDLFLQTSGPSAGLNIGDWYTTPVGSGGGGIGHEYAIDVPASWPSGTPITVALFDPESFDAGVAHTPAAADEVRSSVSDQTTFTLRSPAGAVLQTTVFSSSATDGQWYQLYTFDPGVSGYGQYTLETTTGDNNVSGVAGNDDDNSWRLNVNYDPDCSTGTTGSCVGLVSGNETDNPDGLAGTGDELYAGINRGSFQHAGTTSVCNDYYFFVGPGTPRNGPTGGVLAHNFDMDSNGTVTYTDPNGTTYGGSVSGNATWNNSATSTRVGDELPAIEGWWTAEICLTPNNQYIFEGPSGSTTYLEFQPQTPDIQLVKNDGGLTEVDRGDTVTYTIDFANVSDLSANPGQAFGLQIVDVIPAGVTYVASSCAIGALQTGTCSYDVGSREVTFTIDGPVDPGEAGQVSFQVTVDVDATGTIDNNATAVFADSIGNLHSSTSNVDSNTVAGADLFVQKVVDTNNPVQGATIAFTVTVSNLGGSDATNVVIRDILPAGLAYVSSSSSQGSYFVGSGLWSVGSLASGVTQSLTITADVTGTGTITNVASVAASDQADPDAVNNESSVDVTVTVPDLTVAKTSDATGSVAAGDTIAYTVTITNSGTTTQTGITIDDLLPAQVAYV
ncbi:MAG: DUF11 domain-containing protein, partial [Acidimicrobiia bacterium]|nr:DUF11 domain-containing protein [Acidimicrobiia bacterium]